MVKTVRGLIEDCLSDKWKRGLQTVLVGKGEHMALAIQPWVRHWHKSPEFEAHGFVLPQ